MGPGLIDVRRLFHFEEVAMRTLLLTLLLAVFVAPLAADMQAPGTLAAQCSGPIPLGS